MRESTPAETIMGDPLKAALIGPAGYTNDFGLPPAAADFSTSSGIAGASGDITSAAGLDAYVQNVAASDLSAPVTDSSPAEPPLKLGPAQSTTGGTAYGKPRDGFDGNTPQ